MTEAEKLEAQKMADLGNALELLGNNMAHENWFKNKYNLFFLISIGMDKSLDEFNLSTKENYTDFINRLYARLNVHNVIYAFLFLYV